MCVLYFVVLILIWDLISFVNFINLSDNFMKKKSPKKRLSPKKKKKKVIEKPENKTFLEEIINSSSKHERNIWKSLQKKYTEISNSKKVEKPKIRAKVLTIKEEKLVEDLI